MFALAIAFQLHSNIRCKAWVFTILALAAVHALPLNSTHDASLPRDDASNSTNSFDQLAAFLRSEGATVSPSLRLSTGVVRGIAAVHEVSKGETILVVPPQLILSEATVTRNGAGCAVSRLLAECNVSESEDCKALLPPKHHGVIGLDHLAGKDLELAAFLVQRLHEFKSTSKTSQSQVTQAPWPVCKAGDFPANFIDLYLKTLPTFEDLQGLPVFSVVQPQCRKALNGTWAAHFADGQRVQWAKEWAVLTKRVPEMKRFSETEFFYARAIIMTRTFGMHANSGAQLEPVLVPFGDMLNEDNPRKPGVAWDDQNVSKRGFQLTSTQRTESGRELFITYGKKPNFIVYTTYGFFFDNQRMELVPLQLRPFSTEVSAAGAEKVDSIMKGIPSTVELYFEAADSQLPSILAFARAMALTHANVSSKPGWRPGEDPISLKLERHSLDLLQAHVEAQVQMRSGEDAIALLSKPFELAPSSASCERYSRLNNEPYGALLDFAEEGRQYLDSCIGSTSSNCDAWHREHSAATPLRKKWTSRLMQRWSRQVNPKSSKSNALRGPQKSQRAAFLGM
eukprot:gnl/MRDRNA2_/MRDRNA2_15456_c0_seq1.p1 gnl/MRDRNA2_/MRDRNA2_15456_c0~~gnl/MRDRNA2_/MRDRNA2_15456_c0_seq1.p1  ORF type:complete len:567 (-),score=93.02 gnl/MRDRNA2_/MRDRNA2_15456_c0_seq1:59-1759(-)